jgi:hypothetical protein
MPIDSAFQHDAHVLWPNTFIYHAISHCIDRYIQGAPLLGNSAVASDEVLAVDSPEGGEAVIISTNDKSTPSSVTWRARFVGQGYKQVREDFIILSIS